MTIHISGAGPHIYTMDVTDQGRAKVDALSQDAEELAARDSGSFILHGECHTAAAGAGAFMSFTNTSDVFDVVFTRLFFDAHVITAPSNAIIITQVKRPATLVGGTDVSTTNMINKNFGSAGIVDGTLKISNAAADLTFTGGERYHSFVLNSLQSQQRFMGGTNILTPNTTIVFGWKTTTGANAVDGQVVAISANLYLTRRQS